MSTIKKLAKSSLIYFLGNISSNIVSFFLLPIYTRYLTPSDYGLFDVTTAFLQVAMSILFLDIWSSTLRFMYIKIEKTDKYKAINNGLAIFSFSSLLYIVVLLIVAKFMKINYLPLVIMFGLVTNITQYYSYAARGLGYNKLFAISGVISTFIVAISNVVCIVILKLGVSSLFISPIISGIINILILESKVHIIGNWNFKNIDYILLKKMLIFSLPLSINSVSFWFLSSYNRIAVSSMLSIKENGLYAIAGKFASLLSLAASCFSLAWQETAFAKNGTIEEKGRFFSKSTNMYLKFMIPSGLCLLPCIWFVYPVVINSSFKEAQNYTALYLIGTLLSIISGFLASIFGNIMKNKVIFISTLAGAIVNVISVNVLVPLFNVNGANLSLILGYLITVLVRLLLLKKYLLIELDKRLLLIAPILLLVNVYIFQYGNCIANLGALMMGLLVLYYCLNIEIKIVFIQLKNLRQNSLK